MKAKAGACSCEIMKSEEFIRQVEYFGGYKLCRTGEPINIKE